MATTTQPGPNAETLYRGASGIALAVGLLALVSPRLLVRVYASGLVAGAGAGAAARSRS